MQPDVSGNMLNVILLMGQWLHSRHQYSKPLDEADVEAYEEEVALTEEIRREAQLLTDQEVRFLAVDLDQMRQYIADEHNRRLEREEKG